MTKIAEHSVDVCRLISRPTLAYRICDTINIASFAYLLATADFGPTLVYQGYAKGACHFRGSA